jgi:hypothetical protein
MELEWGQFACGGNDNTAPQFNLDWALTYIKHYINNFIYLIISQIKMF